MSLISDVAETLAKLDPSPRRLRGFGLGAGAALLALAAWLGYRGHQQLLLGLALAAGLALLLAGALRPMALRPVHRAWMALSLVLGWISARVILTVLFALVLTPIALVARLSGKRFLEGLAGRTAPGRGTHWVKRDPARGTHYDKMY